MPAEARKLKPLKDPAEIAKVPVNQPVLVELPEGVTGFDTPAADAPVEAVKTVETPTQDDGTETLRTQLEALKAKDKERQTAFERTQQDAAKERQARIKAEQEANRLKIENHESNKEFLGSALDGATAAVEAAKLEVRRAYEAGDGAALADANAKLGEATADLSSLKRSNAEFERVPKPEAQTVVTDTQPDVLTRIDTDPNLLGPEKEWLKAHPETILDANKNQDLAVGYRRAISKGLERGTPTYFKFLNEFMGYAEPAPPAQTNNNDDTEEAIVSGPVSRDTPGTNGSKSRVMLTPEQRELASTMGLTDVEYASQVLRMQEEKRQNPERFSAGRS